MNVNLRFGMHKDIQLIHDVSHLLSGLVIPGNILAHQAASTSVFVTSVPQLPYVVDPMTHLLQCRLGDLTNDNGDIRPSVGKLLDAYHKDLGSQITTRRRLGADDFTDAKELCKGVVNFQKTQVAEASSTSAANKYLERYSQSHAKEPRAIIPPYFRFGRVGDSWYKLALKCAGIVKKTEPECAPVLCFPSDAIDGDGVKKIAEDYGNYSRILIWVDEYSGSTASVSEICNCRSLYRALSEKKCKVEVLYGGYLTMLSHHDGVEAISHGVLYTEHKSTTSTPGGGGAPERYYIPRIHSFRSLSQTDLILHKHPELICSCDICNEHIQGNPDNIILYRDEPELLRQHFLSVRRIEADFVQDAPLKELCEELKDTFDTYDASFRQLPNPDAFRSEAPMQGLDYLGNWYRAFREADRIGGA